MAKKVYTTIWRNKWITSGAQTIDDFIHTFERLAELFRKWKDLGVQLEQDGGIADDYATFISDNIDVAIKAGFVYYRENDRETGYLQTLDGQEIEVPKEKLKQYNNPKK